MKNQKYDFSGWATRNDIKCSDGRTIRRDAFKHNDGAEVPLVWKHLHDEPKNILGHALLENRDEGVYMYGFFNDSPEANDAKLRVAHGDIRNLSIYANHLKQRGGDVIHGEIREVSLVLAGANPGAYIDFPTLEHGEETDDEGEAVIIGSWGLELEHEDKKEEPKEEKKETEEVKDEKTVADVYNDMTEEQQKVVAFLVGAALEKGDSAEHSDEGEDDMKHNIFENNVQEEDVVLSHDDVKEIMSDAERLGSLKRSVLAHAADYGIDNIDYLFPEAKRIDGNGAPEFIKRKPDQWVGVVMNGVHKTPFAKVKMMFADLRGDEARAKGYAQKGKLKKEEVFGLLKREVGPTTVYKKQKFDRDDIIDITDFDVIPWVKAEMRMMLEEECARAILFGDGRSALDEDKIKENCIIPIVSDDNFYAMKKTITVESGENVYENIIDGAVLGMVDYEGSGDTIFFTDNGTLAHMLLLKDIQKHRLYKDAGEVAAAMTVKRVVTCPTAIMPNDIHGLIVDLDDYNVGTNKGGATSFFDDFDIDFNQLKYLLETRFSGALVRPFSALVLKKSQ